MDSLTQLTLGAAVGEAALGRHVGNKALYWGAALGTLPDLDVLLNPFISNVTALGIHRGLSHSVTFWVLGALLVGTLLHRLHRREAVPWTQWTLMAGLVLSTHALLDAFTTYGTQLFFPITNYPVIFGTIFIIDPAYTLPLLLGVVVAWRRVPGTRLRYWANIAGLGLSTAYLALTIPSKMMAQQAFAKGFEQAGIQVERTFTKPAAFNNVLWQVVGETDDAFYVGSYSHFDPRPPTSFERIPKRHHLLSDLPNTKALERLRWFSRGYYTVSQGANGTLYVHDLRFGRSDMGLGADGKPIFTFRLEQDPETSAVIGFEQDRPDMQTDRELLVRFWDRIWGNTRA
ncbi:MAG: metal-dependent hydrolase [Longimonas sp.]|uniref:metal-dependent hydrolase n=1 Tax=Longimonas sp. TaxID=2039626 RepID=UPI003975AF44